MELQEVIKMFLSGELQSEKMQLHAAVGVANKTRDYIPRFYSELNQAGLNYIQERISGRAKRDPALSEKNGIWIQFILKTRTQNINDYDMLMWAARLCKKHGYLDLCDKIRPIVMDHIKNHEFLVHGYFNEALSVQELDSEDKRCEIYN